MEWAGDLGKMFIITAGVAVGMTIGWVFFHIPKPNPGMGISLVILLWYVQHATRHGNKSSAGNLSESMA